jgi:hypothetical protein
METIVDEKLVKNAVKYPADKILKLQELNKYGD